MSVIYDPHKEPAPPVRMTRASRPKRERRRRPPTIPWKLIGILAVVAALAGGGWYGYQRWQEAQDQAGSPQSALPVDTELVNPQTYLTQDDAAHNRQINFSMVTPKSWHTQSLNPDPSQLLNPKDYQIGWYSIEASGDTAQPGSVTVENITNWLSVDSPKGDIYGKLTAVQKQAFASYLVDMRKDRLVPGDAASRLVSMTGEIGPKQLFRYVNSADGKVSGTAFVTTLSQNGQTVRHAQLLMAGAIDQQTVLVRFDVALTANDVPGGILDAITQAAKSMTFDTSSRDAQAPALTR